MTVTPATLTVTGVVAQDKIYDGTLTDTLSLSGAHLSGSVTGDTVNLDTSGAAAQFADKNVGIGKSVMVSGPGADRGRRRQLHPRPAHRPERQHHEGDVDRLGHHREDQGLQRHGRRHPESLRGQPLGRRHRRPGERLPHRLLRGIVPGQECRQQPEPSRSAGWLTGADAGNYTLAQPTGLNASITAAALTASLTGSVEKTYDGTTAAVLTTGNYHLAGVIGSDVVALERPRLGHVRSKTVGTGKTITVGGLALAGADAGNYQLATASVSVSSARSTPGYSVSQA